MWRMLQAETPDDYVVATGSTHTVQEFLERSFGACGLDWRDHVETDPRYFRPAEVDLLLGDPSRAKERLGWEAETGVPGLAAIMVEHDRDLARREKHAAGY